MQIPDDGKRRRPLGHAGIPPASLENSVDAIREQGDDDGNSGWSHDARDRCLGSRGVNLISAARGKHLAISLIILT